MLLTAVVKILHFFFERIHDFCMPGHVGGQDQRDHPLSREREKRQRQLPGARGPGPAPLPARSRSTFVPVLRVSENRRPRFSDTETETREAGRLPGRRVGAEGWGASQLGA